MAGPKKLTKAQIRGRVQGLDGWRYTGKVLRRKFAAPTFPAAIRFVGRVARLAEAMNHHPDIDIRWRFVTMSLVTHSAGGVTDLDFQLATRIDEVAPKVRKKAKK